MRWNYSLVDITDCQQYRGAISGSDTGTFEYNYYVSDDLPGINRQGYAGRAEPISYSQLLALSDLPESMKSFTLTFVADDKTVLSRTFNYGDSIDESDIPEPPTKSGRRRTAAMSTGIEATLQTCTSTPLSPQSTKPTPPRLPPSRRATADLPFFSSKETTTTAAPSP